MHTMDLNHLIRLFCLCQAVYVVLSSEQHCTKFEYEERLLHKMLRMEFAMERMAEQNNKTIEALQTELEALKAESEKRVDEQNSKTIDTLQTELGALKAESEKKMAEQNSKTIETLQTELGALKAESEKKMAEQNSKTIETLQTELGALKAEVIQIVNSDAMTGSKQVVAFSAKNVKNDDPKPHEVLVFTDVTTNKGNGYDNTTGVFTAPVHGLYLFHDQMCVQKEMDFYHAILVDNVQVTEERYDAITAEHPTCFTAVLTYELRAGQTVSVHCAGINKEGPKLVDDSHRQNIFSGVFFKIL